jgi:6,7-dimethyl-8-ribityllumazine synthase
MGPGRVRAAAGGEGPRLDRFTPHFDYVCNEAARGIQQAQLDTGVPVMFGVLTVNTEQQALDRCEGRVMTNKGEEAAEGAVEMALLLRCLRGQ